jgi:lysylphosphatidylglycerol synthetase-like protein (DUF2156 family)
MSQLHRFEQRPCALESSIRPGYMISFQVYLLHCCFILGLYFYNNVLHLTGIWLEYHPLFHDVFLQSSLGVWYAPNLLIQIFLSSYCYIQCYTHIEDNAWFKFRGMEERNTVQYFAMLSLRIWLNFNSDLYFVSELNMMNTWSLD